VIKQISSYLQVSYDDLLQEAKDSLEILSKDNNIPKKENRVSFNNGIQEILKHFGIPIPSSINPQIYMQQLPIPLLRVVKAKLKYIQSHPQELKETIKSVSSNLRLSYDTLFTKVTNLLETLGYKLNDLNSCNILSNNNKSNVIHPAISPRN